MTTLGNIQIERPDTQLTCSVTHDGYPDNVLELLVQLLQEEGPRDFEAFKGLYFDEDEEASFAKVFPTLDTRPDFSYRIIGNDLLISSYILSDDHRVNAICHPLEYISMLEPDYRDEAVRSINASLASLEALGIVLYTSFVKPARPAALDCRA